MAKKTARRHKSKVKSGKKTAGKPAISGKKRAVAKAGKKTTSSAAGTLRAHALELLKWTHATTVKLAETFTDHNALHQTSPFDNHLMWTMGHLATTYSWVAALVDGKDAGLPANYNALFGYGSKPAVSAGAYPSLAEVRQEHDKAFARLIDAVSKLTDADAMKPTVTDAMGFASSRLDAVYKACWHEGWHQGQVSTIRRALGMKSVY